MHATFTAHEIEQLQRRLEILSEEAENEIRQQLKEARSVVSHLEMQLSDLTGRPTASQIKASNALAPLTDEQLEVQILFVVAKAPEGMNGAEIARQLNQDAVRVRRWVKDNPGKLKRDGEGRATRYFAA